MPTTRALRHALALLAASVFLAQYASAQSVLILDLTVFGGASSLEAVEAAALGFTVDVVNAATWGAMTTAQFQSYDAIILGDPLCAEDDTPLAPAVANRAVWGPGVTGNVIVIGSDPAVHPPSGGDILTRSGIDFAAAGSTTGAYITLSCYYRYAPSGTPVPLLDVFGAFTVIGKSVDDVHIVATHPALSGITDTLLSGWDQSTHEGFESWPGFLPLAINQEIGSPFVASDGTSGAPYIIARGEGLVPLGCPPGGTLIHFETLPNGSGEISIGSSFTDGDYHITEDISGPMATYASDHTFFTGSKALHGDTPVPILHMTRLDSGLFDVCSIDLGHWPFSSIQNLLGHADTTRTNQVASQFVTFDGESRSPKHIELDGFDGIRGFTSEGNIVNFGVQWDNVCICAGGCSCPPTVRTISPGVFCVAGPGNGSNFSWSLNSLPPVPVTGLPVLSAEGLRDAFITSVNTPPKPVPDLVASVAPGSACFALTYTAGFQFFVGPGSVATCLVSGNPAGCAFNPTIYEQQFLPPPVRLAAPRDSLLLAGLLLIAGIAAAVRIAAPFDRATR